ncbi:heparinase II/III domain-containing protein [Lutibacter sp.]
MKNHYNNLLIKKLRNREFTKNIYGLELNYFLKDIISVPKKTFINDKYFEVLGKRFYFDQEINWHKDYSSNFVYPKIDIEKLDITKMFFKGYDVKFPWELSRFHFAVQLALLYKMYGNRYYYQLFKKLFRSWNKENPYLVGVNWLVPMEVAIRLANLILAINIFFEEFEKDTEFKSEIIPVLIQHGIFVDKLKEIGYKKFVWNHSLACFVGLIFFYIFFKNFYKEEKLNEYIDWLEYSIRYQTYNDGVDFEGSLSYHKFSTEMFIWAAYVLGKINIQLSQNYYHILIKRLDVINNLITDTGKGPLVGDNDSGYFIKLNSFIEDEKYGHLLKLGEKVFDYSANIKECIGWLKPLNNKIKVNNFIKRKRKNIKMLKEGGIFILNKDDKKIIVFNIPPGQNGNGGHNHFDKGTFVLFWNDIPIIVDPGTFSYTKDLKTRKHNRSYINHNSVYFKSHTKEILQKEWSSNDYLIYYQLKNLNITFSKINYELHTNSNCIISRSIILQDSKNIVFEDQGNGVLETNLYFHPNLVVKLQGNIIIINSKIYSWKIKTDAKEIQLVDSYYYPGYLQKTVTKKLILNGNRKLRYELSIYTGGANE